LSRLEHNVLEFIPVQVVFVNLLVKKAYDDRDGKTDSFGT